MTKLIITTLCAVAVNAAAQTYEISNPDLKTSSGIVYFENVADGNYKITATLGGPEASQTTIRAESRRLYFEDIKVKAGQTKKVTFIVNKRDTLLAGGGQVRIKPRERSKMNWDSHLSIEFCGKAPAVVSIKAERVDDVPTIFLCGNSTVVDQDNEPWASWGQMLPRFLDNKVCVANYAESGESSNTFIAAKRLQKIAENMKAGDYIIFEFGHNDEKQKGEDKGPYKHFQKSLMEYINLAREKGATPIIITPTQRRLFENGKLKDTHGEFPAAAKQIGEREGVAVIDLQALTTTLFESFGEEGSKCCFVHYPANTYPGQTTALADNTHFNPYGAYQIAKCIVQAIRDQNLPLAEHIADDFKKYNPAKPDKLEKFVWYDAPFDPVKPDGN